MKKNEFKIVKIDKNKSLFNYEKKILIKELTLDLKLGYYDFEKNKPQKVKFSLEIDYEDKKPTNDKDIKSIVNYGKVVELITKLVKNKQNKASKELKEKIGEAKWLIRAINKRNETVQNVGTLICKIQADFLSNKSAELKPISNIELAKELRISASTVSRILRSKYIQTPKGAISMKSLLASSVSKTRKVTPTQLMEEIQKIVEGERKKLSDQKISDLLNKRGFNLARRTISKYRKKINLPSSRNR